MMKQKLYIFILFILFIGQTAFAKDKFHIKISGISGPTLHAIEQQIDILKQSYDDPLSPKEIQILYQIAPQKIRNTLQVFGYFKARITSRLSYQGMEFYINPGPQLPILSLKLKLTGPGKNDPALQGLIEHFPLQPGDPFQTEAYNKAKDTLFHTANHQGYLKAELTEKAVLIDLRAYTVKIILTLDTGPRYYFGKTQFTESPFSQKFLQRFIPYKEGDPFSSQTLITLQQNMSNSPYFQQSIITPEIDNTSDYHVPIHVFTAVQKSQQYKMGMGYGTFTGPRVTLGIDLRRVTDTGHHFTGQVKLSPVLSGLAAKYYIPGKNPLTDQYTIGADMQKFTPKNGESYSGKISAGHMRTIGLWQSNLTLNYLTERFKVEEDPSKLTRLLYPSLNISHVDADNVVFPKSANAVSFTAQGANKSFFSTTSFAQAEIKAKYIFSPTPPSRVILRGNLGYTVVDDLAKLPLTLSYFAGGLGTVRGYPYSSIGPGRYLEVASVEYQHRIYDEWYGAVFYDIGTATNHFNDNIVHGTGIGIIYHSVVGPIQVYVARAESAPGKPVRFEFSIGPDF